MTHPLHSTPRYVTWTIEIVIPGSYFWVIPQHLILLSHPNLPPTTLTWNSASFSAAGSWTSSLADCNLCMLTGKALLPWSTTPELHRAGIEPPAVRPVHPQLCGPDTVPTLLSKSLMTAPLYARPPTTMKQTTGMRWDSRQSGVRTTNSLWSRARLIIWSLTW